MILKLDLRGGVSTMIPVPTLAPNPTPPLTWLEGMEIYGSRKLVCNGAGKPGTSIRITLSSRRPGDANKDYALACSFRRWPGMQFANGEWLNLDVTDPLFFMSALGLAPSRDIGGSVKRR